MFYFSCNAPGASFSNNEVHMFIAHKHKQKHNNNNGMYITIFA